MNDVLSVPVFHADHRRPAPASRLRGSVPGVPPRPAPVPGEEERARTVKVHNGNGRLHPLGGFEHNAHLGSVAICIANASEGANMIGRWVCLDVGETLIDETRIWSLWADELGMTRFTFLSIFGAVIAQGGGVEELVAALGITPERWNRHSTAVQRAYGGFTRADLYGDALPAIDDLRSQGFRVAVIANQPARRHRELAAIGVLPDVMAMSEDLGVSKPDPAFFARALAVMGNPEPSHVLCVGDRLDNDVLPGVAAGLRAVWLRRGPWGALGDRVYSLPPEAVSVPSLAQVGERAASFLT